MLRMMTRNTTINCWDTPGWKLERLNQWWKECEKSWRRHLTDDNSLSRQTWKKKRVTPGRLEESGKILGKDLWVRAHSKETSLKNWLKGGYCTGWIKWLEWDNNLKIPWTDWEWKARIFRDILNTPDMNWESWINTWKGDSTGWIEWLEWGNNSK